MTSQELNVEFEGASWLENRIHVIRGTPRASGPFEIRVNGGADLDIRSEISDDHRNASDLAPRINVPDLVAQDGRRKFNSGNMNDSGVSLGRRASPENHGDVDSTPVSGSRSIFRRPDPRQLVSEISHVLTTPTRPRVSGNKSERATPKSARLEKERVSARLEARSYASSVPSIGGKCYYLLVMHDLRYFLSCYHLFTQFLLLYFSFTYVCPLWC